MSRNRHSMSSRTQCPGKWRSNHPKGERDHLCSTQWELLRVFVHTENLTLPQVTHGTRWHRSFYQHPTGTEWGKIQRGPDSWYSSLWSNVRGEEKRGTTLNQVLECRICLSCTTPVYTNLVEGLERVWEKSRSADCGVITRKEWLTGVEKNKVDEQSKVFNLQTWHDDMIENYFYQGPIK